MSIRVGIAGCGSHALNRIVPLFACNPQMELKAAWSRNPATQARLRGQGVDAVYGELERFLAADIDVVYVASPTGCHFEHACAALRAGRHAWVEKPLATNLAHTRELAALAEREGLMLAEGFMFTWHPQAAAVQQVLARGTLGTPRLVTLTFCFPHLAPTNFRYDPALGGGAWLDHGCYLVKALDWYFPGEWELLGGCLEHDGRAVDVRGAAQLRRSADGMIADLNWGFGHGYVNEMQVIGTEGRLLVESAFTKPPTRSCNLVVEDGKGERTRVDIPADNAFARMFEGYARQLSDPASWPGLRQGILDHAGRFFGLHARLQDGRATRFEDRSDAR
jgi:NDP-hexose-3-ketoreductase